MSNALTDTRIRHQVLSIQIQHKQPIELSALSNSLQALAASHARYADQKGVSINGDAARLYIREIRSGSVIVDLIEAAKNHPFTFADVGNVIAFAKTFTDIIRFFRGETKEPPPDMKRRDAQDVSQFLNPIAIDTGAQVTINATDNAKVVVNQTLTSNDAAAVQTRAANWSAQQREPIRGLQQDRVLYFFQARDDAKGSTGDKGIIETISMQPVKVIFASEQTKASILSDAIFRRSYVVDVNVETVEDKPKLYRIMQVKDSIDRE